MECVKSNRLQSRKRLVFKLNIFCMDECRCAYLDQHWESIPVQMYVIAIRKYWFGTKYVSVHKTKRGREIERRVKGRALVYCIVVCVVRYGV